MLQNPKTDSFQWGFNVENSALDDSIFYKYMMRILNKCHVYVIIRGGFMPLFKR